MHLLTTGVFAVIVGGMLASPSSPLSGDKRTVKDMVGSNMTTPELIEAMGYPAEIHYATTEDGYILQLHRIPYGINGDTGERRPVAYMQHCLLCSSADFIMNSPDKALAYLLADAGYDVWMGNFRGNTYCKNHTTLNPEENKFWQFSWDQMAYYDLPASIDYVLYKTEEETVYFVGFSMGTTAFMGFMSERPEYSDKIKVAALLAPAVFMTHMKGPLSDIAPYSDDIDLMMSLLGYNEFLPDSELIQHFVNIYCKDNATTAQLCYNVLFLIAGPSEGEMNEEYLPIILSHTPAGTSMHTINHYGQLFVAQKFQKYDYGRIGNLNHYGQATPPVYNISNIQVPMGLYWANSDWLATPEDVVTLVNELGSSVVVNHEVEKFLFNHMDFAWGHHADELVYKYVFDLFSMYP